MLRHELFQKMMPPIRGISTLERDDIRNLLGNPASRRIRVAVGRWRNGLRKRRPAPIVEAAIKALLMRPVESNRRTPSTVGEASANCQHADQRTTEGVPTWHSCGKSWRQRKRRTRLDCEIAELKEKARELRERGAIKRPIPRPFVGHDY